MLVALTICSYQTGRIMSMTLFLFIQGMRWFGEKGMQKQHLAPTVSEIELFLHISTLQWLTPEIGMNWKDA